MVGLGGRRKKRGRAEERRVGGRGGGRGDRKGDREDRGREELGGE